MAIGGYNPRSKLIYSNMKPGSQPGYLWKESGRQTFADPITASLLSEKSPSNSSMGLYMEQANQYSAQAAANSQYKQSLEAAADAITEQDKATRIGERKAKRRGFLATLLSDFQNSYGTGTLNQKTLLGG